LHCFVSARLRLKTQSAKRRKNPCIKGSADTIRCRRLGRIHRAARRRQASEKIRRRFEQRFEKKLRQHLVDFLCNLTGGPCAYLEREMKTVHTGLGIDEDDWKEGVEALAATLEKFKVLEKETTEILTAFGGLKKISSRKNDS
jgi:truncated hemoglobin YjbI